MTKKRVMAKAHRDERQGKSPTTQAGEFVREEFHHVRSGKHGARSTKQIIAIGLSKARRAGVNLRPPARGKVSERTRRSAERAYERGQHSHGRGQPSSRRSHAIMAALRREGHAAGSRAAISRQAHTAATHRTASARSSAARRAARTKGPMGRSRAARKAARTRAKQ